MRNIDFDVNILSMRTRAEEYRDGGHIDIGSGDVAYQRGLCGT